MFDYISPLLLAQKIKSREIGVVELVKERLQKSEGADCFFSIRAAEAVEQAEIIQKRINGGENISPLAGIPVSISDNILMKDEVSSAGSAMLNNFMPPFNATVVDKMTEAGLIITGRTKVSEFGIGQSPDSVSPVSSGITDFSFSSDANGGVRTLAPSKGVCFIKPTYGSVSRFGLVAYASSMEQIGVAAASIEDGFAALSLIAGHDKKDGTSYPGRKYEYTNAGSDIKDIRIGLVSECSDDYTSKAADYLEKKGASISRISLPLTNITPQITYILSAAEATGNISRFDGIKFGRRSEAFNGLNDLYLKTRTDYLSFETKLAVIMGCLVLSEQCYDKYYFKAMQIRQLLRQSMNEIFKDCDAVLLTSGHIYGDFEQNYINTRNTALANLTGLPAVSLPFGSSGIQLMANAFNENILLRIASVIEKGGSSDEI